MQRERQPGQRRLKWNADIIMIATLQGGQLMKQDI